MYQLEFLLKIGYDKMLQHVTYILLK